MKELISQRLLFVLRVVVNCFYLVAECKRCNGSNLSSLCKLPYHKFIVSWLIGNTDVKYKNPTSVNNVLLQASGFVKLMCNFQRCAVESN